MEWGSLSDSDTLVRHVPDDEGLVYYKLDHKDALREVNFYYKRGRYSHG